MAKGLPTLTEAKEWFEKEIIPKRTTSAGLSWNRFVKTPKESIFGNDEDPNGLCGSAATYTIEEYFRKYDDYRTSDGYIMHMILWEGTISNHIANIFLPKNKVQEQIYKNRGTEIIQVLGKKEEGNNTFSSTDFLGLTVLDLYYKKATTVGAWWKDMDSNCGGLIGLSSYSNMNETKKDMGKY